MSDVCPQDLERVDRLLDAYYCAGLRVLDALERGQGDEALLVSQEMTSSWPALRDLSDRVMGASTSVPIAGLDKIAHKMMKAADLAKVIERDLKSAQSVIMEQLQALQSASSKVVALPDPDQAQEISIEI